MSEAYGLMGGLEAIQALINDGASSAANALVNALNNVLPDDRAVVPAGLDEITSSQFEDIATRAAAAAAGAAAPAAAPAASGARPPSAPQTASEIATARITAAAAATPSSPRPGAPSDGATSNPAAWGKGAGSVAVGVAEAANGGLRQFVSTPEGKTVALLSGGVLAAAVLPRLIGGGRRR